MKVRKFLALLLTLAMVLPMVANIVPVRAEEGGTEIYDLCVNNMAEPVGVEADPAFSWKMRSNVIGAAQSAYRITVTSQSGDVVWNSGWVESGDSTDIPYGGDALASSTQYTVQIAVKDQTGAEITPVSSTFETGLLEEDAFADTSFISHQTGYISDTTVYTIDFDFIIDKAGQGFCFGMKDSGTFVMWQVNANNNASTDKTVILRPHFKSNGGWTAYPGGPGNLQAVDLTAAIGYNTDQILGKTVHERIEVNGRTIKTYFGKDADHMNLAYTYTHSAEIPLYNLGFRHDNSMATSIPETSYYDNIVVKDANGNVLYGNDFSKNASVQGTNSYEQKDGMLYVYASGEQVGMLMTGEVANADSAPAFRKRIDVKKGLQSAKLYTSGLGVYESYINGERVGTKKGDKVVYDELKPGFTDASARMSYSAYDVTWMLSEGENVLSAMVTPGWWSGPGILHQGNEMAYLAKLILTYGDGTEVIVTDNSWKTAKVAPVMANTGIYEGEDYDATIDTSWMKPGYNDQSWNNAKINTEFQGELSAWHGPAIRVREDLELSPKTMQVYDGITGASEGYYGKIHVIATYQDGQDIVLKPGQTLLVNFGQNFAGREAFTVTSEAGTTIRVDHAEWLNDRNGQISRGNDGPEGSLYTANYRGARAETVYTTAGGTESWHPMYTFYGFQYLALSADKTVTIHDIRGQVLTSVQGDTGTLNTSNADVNRLISNARWGMYSNYLSIPTDCPQRDERMGWTADTQVFSQTGMFLGNNKAFLEKAAEDMRDSQYTDPNSDIYGAYPDVAPDRGWSGDGAFGWADAGIIVPYNLYMMYGDVAVIEENWESMCLFMDAYLAKQTYGGNHQYSDHLCYESQTTTTRNMLSLSFHCWDALMMVQMANAMGNSQAAAKYQAVFEQRKAQYQNEFVNADGTLVADTQTTSLYALYVGLLPNEESENKVADMLIANIQRNGNKLQTGFLGTAILLPTLTKIGRTDVAYTLLLQRGDPSWLYSVDQGATSFWERWNTYTIASGFGSAGMNSFNHYAYGAVIGWIYNQVAGIDYDAQTPGFKHIILTPHPDPLVETVEASYDSAYGPIVSNMRYEGSNWIYDAKIPANTTATIHVPVEQLETLQVNGKAPADVTLANDGLVYKGYTEGVATFEAVAGEYSFVTYAATKYRMTLEANVADPMMPPVEAEVTINGQTRNVVLPTTVTAAEGTEITVKAIPMNPVDYAAAGWLEGEKKLSETDTVIFTASADRTLTVNTKNRGLRSLAVGKTVIAEQVNDDWAAAHLTDGQNNHLGGVNGWSSFGKGSSPTFSTEVPAIIDLGVQTEFNQIHLYPRTFAPANVNFPTAYTIYISDDNNTWTPIYATKNGEVTNGYAPAVIHLESAVNARYVKLGVTAVNKGDETGGCLVQLSELGVYHVTSDMTETTSYTVGFNKSADAQSFDFYSSSNGGFAVSDGKLVPTGNSGEFKAIYKDNGQPVRSVSVELHPNGETGFINAGLYINASNPGHAQDQINTLYVGIESLCTGWEDAPNRIDLILGGFPAWTEYRRVISETGNGNHLFSGGKKEPIRLRVDIIGNTLIATVSLVSNPYKSVSTSYVFDTDLSAGMVGIRSQYNDASYDNFTVVTDRPAAESVAATVGGQNFASVNDAIHAAGDEIVIICQSTEEAIVVGKNVTIDLAGNVLSNVTVSEGAKLNLIDTVSGGTASVAGQVQTLTESDGKTYYVANENGVYSAHSYAIKLTHISLDPGSDALGYKAELIGDDVVKAHVEAIGFNLWVDADRVVTKTMEGKTAASLRLKNILKNNGGEMTIYGNAFVVFDNGETVTCADYGTSMKEVMQLVNAAWDSYTEEQKMAVKTLCELYAQTVSGWELDNIYPIS